MPGQVFTRTHKDWNHQSPAPGQRLEGAGAPVPGAPRQTPDGETPGRGQGLHFPKQKVKTEALGRHPPPPLWVPPHPQEPGQTRSLTGRRLNHHRAPDLPAPPAAKHLSSRNGPVVPSGSR